MNKMKKCPICGGDGYREVPEYSPRFDARCQMCMGKKEVSIEEYMKYVRSFRW